MLDTRQTQRLINALEEGDAHIKKHERMDLMLGEIEYLVADCIIKDDALLDAVCRAFELGVARGYRMRQREARTCRHRR